VNKIVLLYMHFIARIKDVLFYPISNETQLIHFKREKARLKKQDKGLDKVIERQKKERIGVN